MQQHNCLGGCFTISTNKNYINNNSCENDVILFFWDRFNLWHSLLIITFYHQTKTPIGFWCRGLNSKFLIQPLDILLVELTGIHENDVILIIVYHFSNYENFISSITQNIIDETPTCSSSGSQNFIRSMRCSWVQIS